MSRSLLDFYDTQEYEVMGVGNMDDSFSLSEIIEMEMESLGWSQRRLASASNLSSGTISDIVRGNIGLTGRSVACLSASLGLAPDTLIAADSASKIGDICEDVLVSEHFASQIKSVRRFVAAKSVIPHTDINWFTRTLVKRNLWRVCPTVLDDYRDVFYGALSLMRSDYSGEYLWARLESFGIEREYLFDVTFSSCSVIPTRVAQVLGECGMGTIYTWLVMSLKTSTMRYMCANVHTLSEMSRTVR